MRLFVQNLVLEINGSAIVQGLGSRPRSHIKQPTCNQTVFSLAWFLIAAFKLVS